MPIVNCHVCQRSFSVPPNRVLRGWGKYCSRACQHRDMKRGEMRPCDYCGREIYRRPCDARKSRVNRYFCNKSCRCAWANTQRAREKHPNWTNGHATYRAALIRADTRPFCRRCRLTDERVLAVHHIDGDRNNNDLRNLTWLCHNCHHLIHHYDDERVAFISVQGEEAGPSVAPASQRTEVRG
jgi:hypothetical protein